MYIYRQFYLEILNIWSLKHTLGELPNIIIKTHSTNSSSAVLHILLHKVNKSHTNSDFNTAISLQPNVIDLKYSELWIQ